MASAAAAPRAPLVASGPRPSPRPRDGDRRRAPPRPRRGVLVVECRNRVLFREDEVSRRPDGVAAARLARDDPRATHVRDVLKLALGDTLRVGVINDAPAVATVVAEGGGDDATLALEWRARRDDDDDDDDDDARDASRRSIADGPTIELLLACPRPKALRRMWTSLAQLGVRVVTITPAWKARLVHLIQANNADPRARSRPPTPRFGFNSDAHAATPAFRLRLTPLNAFLSTPRAKTPKDYFGASSLLSRETVESGAFCERPHVFHPPLGFNG